MPLHTFSLGQVISELFYAVIPTVFLKRGGVRCGGFDREKDLTWKEMVGPRRSQQTPKTPPYESE